MSGKVLIVDRADHSRAALARKLTTAYFEVLEAEDGDTALSILAAERVDLILMGLDLKGSCGIAVCRRLKSQVQLADIPVVLMTSEDQPKQRVAGFEAGADDFLPKPVDELALFARMRSLARFRTLAEELRLREATSAELGLLRPTTGREGGDRSTVAIIAATERSAARYAHAIEGRADLRCVRVQSGLEAMRLLRSAPPDAFLITTDLPPDENRGALCSALSHHGDASPPAVLVVIEAGDTALAAQCLDQGAADYLPAPVDETELVVRLRAQLKKKLRADRLRRLVKDGLKMSIIDPLTGLYNRRYADQHLARLCDAAHEGGAPLSLILFDIDRFKSVNDRFGHNIGDLALRMFAERLQANLRGVDLIARIGGEEFLIALPGVNLSSAYAAAERLRGVAATATPGAPRITVSAGVSTLASGDDPEKLIGRADKALYQAKADGRNCVVRRQAA